MEKIGEQQIEQENEIYFMEANHGESKICIAKDHIKHLIKMVHDQNGRHINTNNTMQ